MSQSVRNWVKCRFALKGHTHDSGPDLDEQQLSLNGTVLTLSNGGPPIDLASIIPAPPSPHPTPVLCTGRKFWTSNPSGWLGITAGTRVPNSWTYVVPQWRTLLTATSPDCLSEMATTIDLGHALHYMRRARMYHLGEVRILVNGVPIRTYTSRTYNYSDERSDTNPDVVEPLQYEWKHLGVDLWSRQNIAPNSVVELQVAHRVREVAPQTSPYSKAYVGLRSQGQVLFTPSVIQVGETP